MRFWSAVSRSRFRGHHVAQVAACVLAVLVSAVVLFAPLMTREWEQGGPGTRRPGVDSVPNHSVSLWQVDGVAALVVVLIPVLLSALPLLAAQRATSATHLWASVLATVALAGFVLLTGLSVGLFYLPTLACELLAIGLLAGSSYRGRPIGPAHL